MNEIAISSCRSCGAHIIWGVMAKSGKKVPLDLEPCSEGTLLIDAHGLVVTTAEVENGTQPDNWARYPFLMIPAQIPRRKSHFATCPHAHQWRKLTPTSTPEPRPPLPPRPDPGPGECPPDAFKAWSGRVMAKMECLKGTERRILELLLDRLLEGQQEIGEWNLQDGRDYPAEALEEVLDCLHYSAAAILCLRKPTR